MTARRGWVEARHVVNTRPLAELRAFIAAKRAPIAMRAARPPPSSALGAFLLYRATLLPGFDLGDTASFQTMGGLPKITPRDAYPLYYAIARPVVPLFENHAYAMNLLSAVEAALACGVIVLVCVRADAGRCLRRSRRPCCSPARTRSGARRSLPRSTRCICSWSHRRCFCCSAGPRSPRSAGLRWFFAVYAAGLRQPPVDDSAAAGVRGVPAAPAPAGGWRSLLSRARPGRGGGDVPRSAHFSTRGTFSALWREVVPPASFRRCPADVLVRRHEGRLAGNDGPRSAGRDGERTAAHVRVRSARSSSGGCRRLAAAVGLVHLARHDLAARRAPRPDLRDDASSSLSATTSATPTSSSCRRISSLRFWRRSASSPGSGPSGQRLRTACPGRIDRTRRRGTSSSTIRRSTGARSAADGGPDGDDGGPFRTERAALDRNELATAERPHLLRSIRAA